VRCRLEIRGLAVDATRVVHRPMPLQLASSDRLSISCAVHLGEVARIVPVHERPAYGDEAADEDGEANGLHAYRRLTYRARVTVHRGGVGDPSPTVAELTTADSLAPNDDLPTGMAALVAHYMAVRVRELRWNEV